MALSAKVGSFTLRTDTTNNAVTGVGFQPKVVLFFSTKETLDGAAAGLHFSFGAATASTARFAVCMKSDNGSVVANGYTPGIMRNAAVVHLMSGTAQNATAVAVTDFVSMDADGFTVVNSTAPATAYRIGYLALGGTDLANAIVGSGNLTTGTANQSITGAGFQPTAAIFALSSSSTMNTASGNAATSIGFATASTARANICWQANTNSSAGHSLHRTDQLGQNMFGTDTTYARVDLVSFDADGFTLSKATHGSGGTESFGYVLLKVTNAKVGTFASQVGTGNFATTGVGFQPTALIDLSTFLTTTAQTTTVSTHAEFGIGIATASTARMSYWGHVEDSAVTNTSTEKRADATKSSVNTTGQAGAYADEGDIDLVSFDADGFTLNQTLADGSAWLHSYLALGPAAAAATSTRIDGLTRGLARGVLVGANT